MPRQAALQLPKSGLDRTRALADEWREGSTGPRDVVARALEFFNREPFVYTLQPPLLGTKPVDEFLFETRRGFCEHYASAFSLLMRAAGIPARVVTGYLGGDENPVDGFYTVRQSDAHAWAEVWYADRGWVRIDPTSAVAPERIEQSVRRGGTIRTRAAPPGATRPARGQRPLRVPRVAGRGQWKPLRDDALLHSRRNRLNSVTSPVARRCVAASASEGSAAETLRTPASRSRRTE